MTIRILTLGPHEDAMSYADAIVSLAERAQAANATPYLYPQGRDFFERNLQGEASNIVALDEGALVAYTALRTMNPWPDYLPHYGYPAAACAMMLFTLVDPAYRQQGLGKRLSQTRLDMAAAAGIRHLFATVHPDNAPSLGVLSGLGFTLIAQQPLFSQQLMRNVMYLDLHA